jgi:hypothetical protein
MNDLNLGALERDVEAARARLSQDLSVLRSPATVSAFRDDLKHEAIRARDHVVRRVQSSARTTALDFVEQLKAKAAANPAAALVIGAGLAWRLIRKPPIATVLVGAGLFSLLRSTPIRSAGRADVDYMAEAKANLRQQATSVVEELKEQGTALAADVTVQAREFTQEAMQKAQDWSGAATDTVRKAAGLSDRSVPSGWETEASRDQPPAEPDQMKNALLLGAAGVAVALALGMSYRRRHENQVG